MVIPGHKQYRLRRWIWCFRAGLYTLFKIDPTRSGDVLIEVLGKEFNGVLGCDYFSAYRRYHREFAVTLQFYLAHLIRDVKFLTTLPDVREQAYGTRLREALRAQEILAERYSVTADVWSATSYKELRRDALDTERWNMLHPIEPPRKSYIEHLLQGEQGVFLAVSDYMKLAPDMISRWVPGGLQPLGTDGFGRSDDRKSLRRFFEVDAECIAVAVLWKLAQRGEINPRQVQSAIRELGIDPEKANPSPI